MSCLYAFSPWPNRDDSEGLAPPAIDPARVSALFANRRHTSFITREVARRMAERLDVLRIDPQIIFDCGCGAGPDLYPLSQRYPPALVFGADLAPHRGEVEAVSMLQRLRQGVLQRLQLKALQPLLRADMARLPLADASVDLIWSNCALHWVNDAEGVVAEWSRVAKPEAALMFSCFGPDTLKQVRQAFAALDLDPHCVAFTDLHDYGDMLSSHGFAQPVMDMEQLTLTYQDSTAFWRDVRELGGNALHQRRRGLMSRGQGARLEQALEAGRNASGALELSVEIVYGHAFKGSRRERADGLKVVAMPKTRG